jgi:hypothetical protein
VTSGLSKETLLGIEADPAAVLSNVVPPGESAPLPVWLVYELARWHAAQLNPKAPGVELQSYAEHLRSNVHVPGTPDVSCALLYVSLECAKAEDVSYSSVEESATITFAAYDAWLQGVPPHTFSTKELDIAEEVYVSLVSAEDQAQAKMVAAVLEHDVTAERLVRTHVGAMLASEIITYLSAAREQYPEATWVSTLARDLPSLATVGDLREPTTVAAIAQAMEELGGLRPAQISEEFRARGVKWR